MADRGPIPTTDAEFSAYINQVIPYLQANNARLGVSGPNVNDMIAKLAEWSVLYPKTLNKSTSTPALTEEKNLLRDDIEELLRSVYADIPESALTNEDRNVLSLPLRDTEPTPTEVPINPPDIELKETGVGSQRIHVKNFEDPNLDGIPAGVDHIRASWHIGDNPPENPKDFINMKDFTTAKFIIDFGPEDSGKKVHIAVRYIGNRGQEGHWSKVIAVGIA